MANLERPRNKETQPSITQCQGTRQPNVLQCLQIHPFVQSFLILLSQVALLKAEIIVLIHCDGAPSSGSR